MERVGISRVFVYLVAILSFLAGGLFFSYLCHDLDFNILNDEDDTHALEFTTGTTYDVKTQSLAQPSAEKAVIDGQQLNDSDKKVLAAKRRTHSTPLTITERKVEADTVDTTTPIRVQPSDTESVHISSKPPVIVGPCEDKSFKVEDTLEWTYTQNITTPDTSYIHTQKGADTLSFYVDCLKQKVFDFNLSRSALDVVTINKTVTNTVIKRPWLYVAPYVETNALNTSQWTGGVEVAVRYGDFWLGAGAESPMAKDMQLRLPVRLRYELFTLER